MLTSRWNSLAAVALASTALTGFAIAEEPTAEPIVVRARAVGQVPNVVPLEVEPRYVFVADGADEASPYWIGVQLEPPTDILKQHLNLEGGMVAVHVFDDSPAQKAGLKVNDIIVKAGDGYIKEPGDLLTIVGAAEGKELTLVLIRGGKEQTLKVVPAKRPQENPQALRFTQTEEKEAERNLEEALDRYRQRAAAGGEARAVDVLRLRPGVVAERSVQIGLPKDVSVTITKEGESPAKIVVKKDGKEYTTTEEKLGELPQDVQKLVQVVRGGERNIRAYRSTLVAPAEAPKTAVKPRTLTIPLATTPATEPAKVYRYHVEGKHAQDDVDSKLSQILKIVSQKEDSSVSALRKEVEQLRKEIEELRKEKK